MVVPPAVVSAVTGGPYQGTPSPVAMTWCPPWSRAAAGGGHTPRAPAWMCIACGESSSPLVPSDTVATSPLSLTTTSPTPLTLLNGTGARSPVDRWPADSVDDAEFDEGV